MSVITDNVIETTENLNNEGVVVVGVELMVQVTIILKKL